MKYNFDEIIDRKGTNCLKHDALKQFFGKEDILPMWVADSDFRVPNFVIDAISKRLEHPILGYTCRGEEFYNSVVSWLEKRGDWQINPSWIDYSAGVVTGLAFLINSLTRPVESILIQTPVYPPFADIIKQNGRTLLTNELIDNNGHFEIDFEDFEEKIKKASLFIMCNPHNPIGRVFTKEELVRMGDLCIKHDVFIVSDEIHSDIIMKPHKHIHIASLSEEIANRTVTLIAPSKTFNLAGLSTAVSIISNPRIKKLYCDELSKYHIDLANIFGIEAFTAAYTHGDLWVDEMNDYIADNFRDVIQFCQDNMPNVRVIEPEASYLMWLDFSKLNISEKELQESLINDAKIGLNKGSDYGVSGEGFMRLNVSTPLSVVKEAMRRIKITYDKFQ